MVSNKVAIAIANLAIFLEFCSAELLDEGTAVQAMEQLAADLQELDQDSRRELVASFRSIAARYDDEARSFVENMPYAFGIE
jgi:hypothetical protein